MIRGAKSAHAAVPLLSDTPVGALAAVAGSRETWWVRAAAIEALRGRADATACDVLLTILRDTDAEEALRVRAVQTLVVAAPPGLPSALRALAAEARTTRVYDLDAIVVMARATLGDPDVALALLQILYARASVHTRPAQAALAELEARAGYDLLARIFGAGDASASALSQLAASHPEPEVRRWAIAHAPGDAPWLVSALADEPLVVEGAFARVTESSAHVDALMALVWSDAETATRAWAALALHRLGHRGEARAAWTSLGDPPLVDVPVAVRRAVLYEYLPSHRGTDPRHLLEAEIEHGFTYETEHEEGPDEPPTAILEAANRALVGDGLALERLRPIEREMGVGYGTYHAGIVDGVSIYVCTRGRFFASEDELPPHVVHPLERAGFLFIEGDLARTKYSGLQVYDFGDIREKSVFELLFHWVD
jgi:hypothetical protein